VRGRCLPQAACCRRCCHCPRASARVRRWHRRSREPRKWWRWNRARGWRRFGSVVAAAHEQRAAAAARRHCLAVLGAKCALEQHRVVINTACAHGWRLFVVIATATRERTVVGGVAGGVRALGNEFSRRVLPATGGGLPSVPSAPERSAFPSS